VKGKATAAQHHWAPRAIKSKANQVGEELARCINARFIVGKARKRLGRRMAQQHVFTRLLEAAA
jgi:hypothetical protein